MRHGEVWWAKLPPPASKRPVLILTRDSVINTRTSVTVAPITSTIRRIPVEVPLDAKDGMPVKCIVNLDDIITIRKSRLVERITALSAEKISEVTKAIAFALDLHL